VTLADRLLEILRQPISIAGTNISTSASIGITFSGLGYATPADMLRDADIAMYKAKSGGKDRYALFDTALHTEVLHRLRLEGDLRRALVEGQLSVAYQPLFELTSGRAIGFEALVRWDHPELGPISPTTFVPVAEDSALIVQLTDFVLYSACRQLGQWQRRDRRLADLCMRVNLSGHDVAHAGLVARVNSAIIEGGLQPRHLTLELTENILMERLAAGMPTLRELRRCGFGLSIDDFGTGYSSLRHLSSLPVDSLKMDRSFIADLQPGSNDAAVVQAIIQLGSSLGKSIIAEGIETAHQMEQLRRMGCDICQGFFLSEPLSTQQVDRMLEALVSEMPALSATRASELADVLH
jgi:predicted signal transduction protein with EAL and GGDEF domain